MIRGIWKAALAVAIAAACLAGEARAAFSLNITGPGGYNQTVNNGTDSITITGSLPGGGISGITATGNVGATFTSAAGVGTITSSILTLTNTNSSSVTLVFTATATLLSSSSGTPTITTALTFLNGSGSAFAQSLINNVVIPGSTTNTLSGISSAPQTTVNPAVVSPFAFSNQVSLTVAANTQISVQAFSTITPTTVVPEPSTMIALATALPLLGFKLRRRQKALAAA